MVQHTFYLLDKFKNLIIWVFNYSMINLIDIIYLIATVLVIVKCADFILKAAANIAKELGISEYFIGFGIIAFGTSLPEIATAIFGSIAQKGSLIFGDLIGASILDMTLVLGIMAVAGGNILIEAKMFRVFDQALFMSLGITLLPLFLGLDGKITRIDGIFLLIAYLIYLIVLIKREEKFKHHKHIVKKEFLKNIIILVVSLPILLLCAKFLVSIVTKIGVYLQISDFIMGLTILAFATTFPELTLEFRSILKGRRNIGFGDVLGSLISNVSLILGIAALINPFELRLESFITANLFLVLSTFVALLFFQKKSVTWKEGLALILIYITFVISEVVIG
ncbi:sodium:calcium antiporter [Candidatus Woesearchaeota archaeon]|nr:sodium:calcium antiporter [Candidatus Woesearchaeota archaeon]